MKFECTQCGRCCKWPGVVRLFPIDVDRILRQTLEGRDDFVLKNCIEIKEHHQFLDTLLEFSTLGLRSDNDGCIFLEKGNCGIHSCKPLICSIAPFSYTHWTGRANRERYLRESPGFGSGRFWSKNEVAVSIEKEVIAWESYFLALQAPGTKWWMLYGLQVFPGIPTVQVRSAHNHRWGEQAPRHSSRWETPGVRPPL